MHFFLLYFDFGQPNLVRFAQVTKGVSRSSRPPPQTKMGIIWLRPPPPLSCPSHHESGSLGPTIRSPLNRVSEARIGASVRRTEINFPSIQNGSKTKIYANPKNFLMFPMKKRICYTNGIKLKRRIFSRNLLP